MGKYFTISELCRSTTAQKRGINNTPSVEVERCLHDLINYILDPVREKWGKPVPVNSGYRCPALNSAVKGATASQHLTGQAADISAGSKAENKRLFDIIAASGLPFDQLIDESGYSWIHISYGPRHRRQVLHL